MGSQCKELISLRKVVPIVAGRLPNGEEGYVASDSLGHLIHSGQAKAVPSLSLAILRFVSDAYTRSDAFQLPTTSEEVLGATNPYHSWTFVRHLPRIQEIQDGRDEVYDRYKNSDSGDV